MRCERQLKLLGFVQNYLHFLEQPQPGHTTIGPKPFLHRAQRLEPENLLRLNAELNVHRHSQMRQLPGLTDLYRDLASHD